MNEHPTESVVLVAAGFLPWLVEMGADEVVLDAPVDRMMAVVAPPEIQPEPAPVKKLLLQVPPQVPALAPRRVVVSETATVEESEALAASCGSIADIVEVLSGFDNHPLKKSATRLAFLAGASASRILVLCDKPRSEEDRGGEVLAGKHQVLAEKMLAAIGLSGVEARDGFEQVTLANFMPWRPPGNRGLLESECLLVVPLINRFIALLAPKAILCLGPLAGQYLAGGEEAPVRARGKWLTFETPRGPVPMLTTFHPETLLKSPQSKRLVWQDLQAFRRRIAAS